MSLYGIRPPASPAIPPRPTTAPGITPGGPSTSRAPASRRPDGAGAPSAATHPAPAQAAVPAHPPAGTDPDLWSVLTSEERAHFARLGAMGPLTYGRVLTGQMTPPSPTARGGRVDVRA